MQTGYDLEPANILPDGFWGEDDEGWGFVTGPEFGCVHFTAKDRPILPDEIEQLGSDPFAVLNSAPKP
jgi:hypothetical protein